ncbi:MAG: hypothetical protein LQ340_001512 [Diploschistes diacapsis]|nr:MAG: hypothetical protein LQ340_001512 [Diploschistes diacapsis]
MPEICRWIGWYGSRLAVRRYSEARRKGLALELDECAVQLVRLRARAPPILRGLQVGAKSEAEELQLKYDTQGIVMASAINGKSLCIMAAAFGIPEDKRAWAKATLALMGRSMGYGTMERMAKTNLRSSIEQPNGMFGQAQVHT